MQLINIANKDRKIFLFTRDNNGEQKIIEDNTFYPYFYEPDENGKFISYDGKKLRQEICTKPSETTQRRSPFSYSSDVRYPIRYITDRIDEITIAPVRYMFMDIEVLADDLPDPSEAKYPISCITVYDSFLKKYFSWYLGDYEGSMKDKENKVVGGFIEYLTKYKPDLWLSWNVDFDYTYLYNRIKGFSELISPIGLSRVGSRSSREKESESSVYYPAGMSIMDYMVMFKKVNNREPSYALDAVAEKYFGQGKKHKDVAFGVLDPVIKARNREDVEIMVRLEERFNLIQYFNEIRLFSKALWEDLTFNSKILDSVILSEGKKRNIILPSKPKFEDDDEEEEEEFEGAYRRSEGGLYYDIWKADVSSMYPAQLVNFCLDTSNAGGPELSFMSDWPAVEVEGTWFKQNPGALIPKLATDLMKTKAVLKKKLKEAKIGSDEAKMLQIKYDAFKGLVNSVFGVMGCRSFRLYDVRVASAITGLARDLLHYCEDGLQKLGFHVIYADTDALMYKAPEDKVDMLNELTQYWAMQLGKKSVEIEWESEGKFTKLLILGKCHYYGYIDTGKGIKKEIKGVEIKRSSSSAFEAYFQETLIEKILNGEDSKSVKFWVKMEREKMKNEPLQRIGFPCKIRSKDYDKTTPVFIRAYQYTQKFRPEFKLNKGERFYYTYIKSLGKDSDGKEMNVLAFSKDESSFIDRNKVDWERNCSRSIDDKAEKIFEAIGWNQTNKARTQVGLF